MKAKQTITASAAVAALALTWWRRRRLNHCARDTRLDEKCMQDALARFEGEGGLVTS